MEKKPLISVAMATYNGAKFLEEQLDSILNQTYPNIEIIIVDDCSTDNTFEVLEKYANEYSNIQILANKTNEGVNKSFDRAINLCKGDYIAISDQDDIWIGHKLELLFNSIENNILVYSHSALMDEKGVSLNRYMTRASNLYEGDDPRSMVLYNRAPGHTFFFKSSLREKITPIPKHCYYDAWIALVATNTQSIGFIKDPLVLHRIHPNNVTKSMKVSSIKEGFYYLDKYVEAILKIENLKHKDFFNELHSILNIKNFNLKVVIYIYFQFKYCNIIYNKNPLSNLNKARKINIPPIPH